MPNLISSVSWFNWWFLMFLWSKFDSNLQLVYWIASKNSQLHKIWSPMHDFKYCIYYIAYIGWFIEILWSYNLIDVFKIYYLYYNVELKFSKRNLIIKMFKMSFTLIATFGNLWVYFSYLCNYLRYEFNWVMRFLLMIQLWMRLCFKRDLSIWVMIFDH